MHIDFFFLLLGTFFSAAEGSEDVKGPQNMQQVFIMEPKQRETVREQCSLTLLLK